MGDSDSTEQTSDVESFFGGWLNIYAGALQCGAR
jgi:hypothetical protein